MTTEANDTDEGIRRALDAADAANTAAQEIAELSAAHKAFAEAVMKGQKRNTLMAGGAAAGAVVALMLGGLVYLRSVADLREAGEVQIEAARLLVEEVAAFDSLGDTLTAQQELVLADIATMLDEVKSEIALSMQMGEAPADDEMNAQMAAQMTGQMATAIRDGVKEDMGVLRDEMLQALAELDQRISTGGGAVDGAGMATLQAEIAALTAKLNAAPAPAAAAPARATTRPKPKPAAEPNPFSYP